MPTVEGIYICEHCGTKFNWDAFLPQKLSEIRYPSGGVLKNGYIHPLLSLDDTGKIARIKCRCPNWKCDKIINFDYHLID